MRTVTLIFEYRCAVCWGMLTERDDQIECFHYPEHKGYHRLSGIEWQKAHSEQDLHEVARIYQELKPWCYLIGLATPPQHGAQLQAQLNRNRRALGRDDSGL